MTCPLLLLKEHWEALKGVVKARLPKKTKLKTPAACLLRRKPAGTLTLDPAPVFPVGMEGIEVGGGVMVSALCSKRLI